MFQNDYTLFWRNLEKIKDALLLNDSELALSLGLGTNEYFGAKKKKRTLPVDCLFELAEKYNFHLEDLLLNNNFVINYNPHKEVPLLERYTLAAYGHTRGIINVLNYLELTRGTRAKINLIRKFQLSEDFIRNEKNNVNFLLMSDILKYLKSVHHFGPADFVGIGRRMPFITNNTILKDKLSLHNNTFDIVECFIYECAKLFDKNCTYTISEGNNDYAIINVLPNKNVVDELNLKARDFGSEEICLTKMGNISSAVFFKYGKYAPIKKINSIHTGHQSNQYLVDLSSFKKQENLRIVQ